MNENSNPYPKHRIVSKVVFGLSLVAVGVAILLHQLGIVDADRTLRFWPMLLVLMGLTKLFTRGVFNMGGHVLILIGGGLQLAFLGHWDDMEAHMELLTKWWPLGIVWIGLVLICRAIWPQYSGCCRKSHACCQDSQEKDHEHEL